ncbi:14158_t:CDS:2, partial [Cetraspora pellucida]
QNFSFIKSIDSKEGVDNVLYNSPSERVTILSLSIDSKEGVDNVLYNSPSESVTL